MRPLLPVVCLTFCSVLPGCLAFSTTPRTYTYDINLRNTTGRPISVEFLRIDASRVTKTRCDIADGGFYANRFTTFNSAEYLEARLRYLDQPDTAPRHIAELPREFRADVIVQDNQLSLKGRPNSVPDPK